MSGLWLSHQQGCVDLSELRAKSTACDSARYRVLSTRIFLTNIFGAYRSCSHCGLKLRRRRRRRIRREVADIERRLQQLGLGQHGLRLRNHVRGCMLAALGMVMQQSLHLGKAATA
jgi:hypothetical protein